ncbi:hypothetical protein DFQ26_005968 [Actinomortierella ambigua]|nr:hypothetical protein DFQ26_005968 [Actinomortierella ambigua]
MATKNHADSKQSTSFEMIPIGDVEDPNPYQHQEPHHYGYYSGHSHHHYQDSTSSIGSSSSSTLHQPTACSTGGASSSSSSSHHASHSMNHHRSHSNGVSPTREKSCLRSCASCSMDGRGRLVFLAAYLLISASASLYFSLVQAGLGQLDYCHSIASCFINSSQGWPAMGQGSMDLVIMSYMSGLVSVLGGLLGFLALWGAIKKSASKVMLFARLWWGMIGIMIGSTILTLFMTIAHREQFMDACQVAHQDAQLSPESCGFMYGSAVVGSVFGCLIGVTMIWCYGSDVLDYAKELQRVKEKTRAYNGV